MIGKFISFIRKEKKITKAEISRITNIDTGHLTHIEKGERNPSHKLLKSICKALEVPFRPIMYTYDKEITEEQEGYKVVQHLSYNKILAVDDLSSFIELPAAYPSASIAVKMTDNSMEPKIPQGSYMYIELNTPLNNKDTALFSYNNELLVRKFVIRKDCLVLRAENKDFTDICLSPKDNFYIVGRVIGNNYKKN